MAKQDIVVIGASAGGVEALQTVASGFTPELQAAVFVVLHIGKGIDGHSALPDILARAGRLPTSNPLDGQEFRYGHIYVAKPDCHMLLEAGRIRVVSGPKENLARPAINPLFRSAANAYGSRVTGVILTGLLDDGVAGLAEIKRHGGIAIVQEPSTALFQSMPCNAIQHVDADYITPLKDIAGVISQLAGKDRIAKQMAETLTRKLIEQKCPECSGPLWEERQGRIVEYRCRIGHAYSSLTLRAEYEEEVEKSLRHAMVALLEAAELDDQLVAELGRDFPYDGNMKREQAEAIRRMLEMRPH